MKYYILKGIKPSTTETVVNLIKFEMGKRNFPLAVRDSWDDLNPELVRVPGGTVPGGELFSLEHFEFEKTDMANYMYLKA